MSTVDIEQSNLRRGTVAKLLENAWTPLKGAFECHAVFIPEEEEGSYSAQCVNLPGVISQGDTLDEAMANVADAFRETVLYYRSANKEIPWKDDIEVERPEGTRERWILVQCGH